VSTTTDLTAGSGDVDLSVVPAHRESDLRLEEDGQLAVYDPEAGLVVLNASAAAIWDLCDGSTSLGAVVEHLRRRFSTIDDELISDVWATYRHLARLGLIEDARRRTVSSDGDRGPLGRLG
jgi:hypothetical protein